MAVCGSAFAADPPRVLTLEDARMRARAHHPSLRAAGFDVDAARARSEAAGRAENPTLAASIENVGGSLGSDRAESAVRIEQPFALGGDRGARSGAGRAALVRSEAEHAEIERELDLEVHERFVDAWAGQERLGRLRAAEDLAARAVRAAEERRRAGAAPAFELARATGFESLRAIERRRAEAELAAVRRRLVALWPGDEAAFDSLALPEPARGDALPPDSLRARLASHPRNRTASAEAELRSWRAREARAARVPDIAVGAGVRHLAEVPGTGFEFALSMPLPLWNGGGAEVDASDAELSAARERVRRTEAALDAELDAAALRYAAALETHAAVRDRLVPASHEALRLIGEGYRAGRLGSLEIQEGQRSVLEAELLLVDASADVWRAQGALEALTGVKIEGGAR